MRGISIPHLERLFVCAKAGREKYVRVERCEFDLIIRELKSRRRESKKLRLKRNKQTKQIVNLAAKLNEGVAVTARSYAISE